MTRWTDDQVDGLIDRLMDDQVDGWMDGLLHTSRERIIGCPSGNDMFTVIEEPILLIFCQGERSLRPVEDPSAQ